MLLNLKLTMGSGQPPEFLWNKEGDRYSRVIGGKKCQIWQVTDIHTTPGCEDYVYRMLRIQDDLEDICRHIGRDGTINKAIGEYRGLRITKSDPWETLVCFICSINSNIPQIRKNVQSLMRSGSVMPPGEMAKLNLRKYSLGFRGKYLKETAKIVAREGLEISKSYHHAHAELQELPGVGPKVADCVLLFGYGHLMAFPVDVWIARAVKKYYGVKKNVREWAHDYFGDYAGYANQYLYCMVRGV